MGRWLYTPLVLFGHFYLCPFSCLCDGTKLGTKIGRVEPRLEVAIDGLDTHSYRRFGIDQQWFGC